jgi:hypothetical protein
LVRDLLQEGEGCFNHREDWHLPSAKWPVDVQHSKYWLLEDTNSVSCAFHEK